MRTRTAALMTVVLVASAALAAGPAAAAAPGYCRGSAPLDIDQLPERIDLARCDIVGRTIVAEGLRVVVPPPGQGRIVQALRTAGEGELDVRTTPDGQVLLSASTEQPMTAAAAPSNDSLGSAEVVQTPTSYSWFRDGTTVDATVQARDAEVDTTCATSADKVPDRTVWYRYVAKHYGLVNLRLVNVNPAGAALRAQVFQSSALYPVRCANEEIYVMKGETYYIRVGSRGAPASFRLKWYPPAPPHDAFGKAPSNPMPSFTETRLMTGATLQSGEPTPECKTTTTGTVWHRVDPGTLRRLNINGSGTSFALYRGSALTGLAPVACRNGTWGGNITLPGTGPYYIQQWVKPGVELAQMYVMSGEPYPYSPAPCDENDYATLSGIVGRKAMNWRYNGANAPASLGTSALPLIKQGIGIISASTNDCGLSDLVSAQQSYLGNTARVAGMCASSTSDGLNTVDFGTLDYNTLGIACSTTQSTDGIDWVISETDLRLSRQTPWTLNPDGPSCSGKYDLVGVVAHEAGHAFALDHPYGQGNQTMSAYNKDCTSAFRTLGRGDVLGLRALY